MNRYRLGEHGLSWVLLGLFMASWFGQLVFQFQEFTDTAVQHGEPLPGFISGDFWADFLRATLENWQSEFLQILTFVLLTKWLIHRGSHESRDGEDEMRDQLDRIERELDNLNRSA